jgi:NADPH:quinone reductase-like Zn-dependent oxidoreductase
MYDFLLSGAGFSSDIIAYCIADHDVLIRVKMAGVNPVDHITVSGTREIMPLPHIPGAETSAVVEEVGKHVVSLKRGDRVIVHNKVFDGI